MILLDPLARPVIGHRGNRAHAPEDTLPSLGEAVALGVDALEFDLHVSSDGHLVVIHDPTLERTTDETGPVAQRTLSDLRRIDAGYRFTRDGGRSYPLRGRGATIPSFDDVVESLPRELALIVELKTPMAAEPLRAAIRRHGLAHRVIVAGFSAESVAPLRGEGFAIGASMLRWRAPSRAHCWDGRIRRRSTRCAFPRHTRGSRCPSAHWCVRCARRAPLRTCGRSMIRHTHCACGRRA
ncbi:MAG: hypothetical protein IPP90_18290 [Gemmatimonadaceae bacterium]|nr:hypothetical protein [Gemmatimonadaceae bacterium]